MTFGADKPVVVLSSAIVSLLEPDELKTVLGHELGHVTSRHVEYTTALIILIRLAQSRLPSFGGPLSNLPLRAVLAALLEWRRAAERTCDRASTLVNRDPLITSHTLMVISSRMPSRGLNLDAFLKQGSEYEEWRSMWDRFSRFRIELQLTHDVPVRRVNELMHWVRSGAYEQIINGNYIRRGNERSVEDETADAVRHYTKRFKRMFEATNAAINDTTGRIAEWLNKPVK